MPRIVHLESAEDGEGTTDILSKHWSYPQVWHNLKPLLFFQGDTAQLYDEG